MFISQYIKMMSAVIVLLSAMSLWGQNDTLGTRDNPQKIEWKKLENVTVEEKDYLYVPTFGADILALKGKYIQLRG